MAFWIVDGTNVRKGGELNKDEIVKLLGATMQKGVRIWDDILPVGVCTGLGYTDFGGTIVYIEVCMIEGKSELK